MGEKNTEVHSSLDNDEKSRKDRQGDNTSVPEAKQNETKRNKAKLPKMDEKNMEMQPLLEDGEKSGKDGQSDSTSFRDTLKGLAAAFTWLGFVVGSAVCVQLLEKRIPDLELNMFRSRIPFIIYAFIAVFSRKLPVIPKTEILGTVLYTLTHFIISIFYCASFTLLPAALVQSIDTTMNITSGLFLFSLFLEERITVQNIVSAFLCIFGVFLVIQPGSIVNKFSQKTNVSLLHQNVSNFDHGIYYSGTTLMYGNYFETGIYNSSVTPKYEHDFDEIYNLTASLKVGNYVDIGNLNATSNYSLTFNETSYNTFYLSRQEPVSKGYLKSSITVKVLRYIFAIIPGLTLSLSFLLVKRKPFLKEHVFEVLFWTFFIHALLSAVLMGIVETPVLPSNWYDTALVTFHGTAYSANIPLNIYAIRYVSGNTMNLVFSTSVVFFLIAQYTLLSHILPGHRNWIEVVGVVLVLLGAAMSSVIELIRSKSKESETSHV